MRPLPIVNAGSVAPQWYDILQAQTVFRSYFRTTLLQRLFGLKYQLYGNGFWWISITSGFPGTGRYRVIASSMYATVFFVFLLFITITFQNQAPCRYQTAELIIDIAEWCSESDANVCHHGICMSLYQIPEVYTRWLHVRDEKAVVTIFLSASRMSSLPLLRLLNPKCHWN